jgi:hypothetical protein
VKSEGCGLTSGVAVASDMKGIIARKGYRSTKFAYRAGSPSALWWA